MYEKYFCPWSMQKDNNHYEVTDADGIYIWINEKKCYDMSSQAINVNIGHKNTRIINAIKEQCDRLPFIASAFKNEIRELAAEEILSVAPLGMEKVYFTASGAEANENAIKIARMFKGRTKIFSAYNSYHGSTIGAGTLTGDARRFSSEKDVAGFVKFEFPDKYHSILKFSNENEMSEIYIKMLENQIINENPKDIAAIFVEPIIGGNGVIIPPEGYLQGVRKICDKYGILMVCDEVMTGWGRTGKWFGIENWDITPDIITTSKGITSSYIAFGAVIVNKEISEFFIEHPLMCGSTNYGHLLGCAATVANIKEYKEKDLIKNSMELGIKLGEILNKFKEKYKNIGDVRVKGLFACIEFVTDRETKQPYNDISKIIPDLIERGFWTLSRRNLIMIAPPLIINEEELTNAMTILDEVLEKKLGN